MIDRLTGTLLRKSPAEAIIEIGGVAFQVTTSLSTSEKLGAIGTIAQIYTYLHVREEILQLYGFHTTDEREIFIRLLKISGIGPKTALAIVSRFDPKTLVEIIKSGQVSRLTSVPGIGKKTAERLMLEMKGRIETGIQSAGSGRGLVTSTFSEALRAMESLGFSESQADEAVKRAKLKLGDDATIEDLIKEALRR